MTIEWQVENQQGTSGKLTSADIMEQLKGQGEAPLAVSPDGQFVTLQDGQGQFQVRAQDLLTNLGWQIKALQPQNAVEDFAKPEWRAAVANLGGNDDVKRQFLAEKMAEMGVKDPQIVGSGTDWWVFHPESGKYYAMTNKPGLDSTDVVSALTAVPGVVGSLVGGALGMATPVPGGTFMGAAGGQVAGDVAARAGLAAYDPTFARLAGQNLGEQVKDIGLSAAFAGGAGQLGKMIPGLARMAPASTTARMVGGAAEEAGKAVQGISRAVNTGLGRELAAGVMPGTAEASLLGYAAQAPAWLGRLAARGMERFGGARGKEIVEGARAVAPRSVGQRVGQFFSGSRPAQAAPKETMESFLGSVGRDLGMGAGGNRGAVYRAFTRDMRPLRDRGMPAWEALQMAKERAAAYAPRRADTWQRAGQKLGRVIDGMERGGQSAVRASNAVAGGMARTAGAAASVPRYGGKVLRETGRALAGVENQLWQRYGAEEFIRPRVEDAWRTKRPVVPYGQDLVSNY